MTFERVDLSDDVTLYRGDCLDILPTLAENSVDTIVTDPPYGLKFMGKGWDHGVPGVEFWTAALRVAKPGAMLMAFGGTRTHHRLMCAIEDAGWEIRDVIMWVYGSGFPKSHDISKAIDKAAGVERGDAVVGGHIGMSVEGGDADNDNELGNVVYHGINKGAQTRGTPHTPQAQLWNGWGTALKPAWEPIIVAMKPLDGTFANNALTWGVAGLWVDGARVPVDDDQYQRNCSGDRGHDDNRTRDLDFAMGCGRSSELGRWPANLIHDGSDEVVELFPYTESGAKHGIYKGWGEGRDIYGGSTEYLHHSDASSGSAARFFYCAKASSAERNAGLDDLNEATVDDGRQTPIDNAYQRGKTKRRNTHPTVKPLELMRYLVRLTKTPTGGVVLDPFMGSGTTGMACALDVRDFVGIELDADFAEIARRRIVWAKRQTEPPVYETTIDAQPVEVIQPSLFDH